MVTLPSSTIGIARTHTISGKIGSPVHPAVLMVAYWLFIVSVCLLGPINLTPAISTATRLFLIAHILLFILGSTVFLRINLFKNPVNSVHYIRYIPFQTLYILSFIVLSIGITGGLLNIFSKLSSVDAINLSAITQLRVLKAQALIDGEAVHSGFISSLSALIYPAGFVGLVTTIICYESTWRLCRLLSFAFVIIIVLLAVCAGGRSPIIVLFLFAGSACYVRKKLNKSYIPKSLPVRLTIITLLLLFAAYSSLVWVIRAKETGTSPIEMLSHAENVWGAHPKESLLETSDWLNNPGFAQSVVSSTFYFIQNLSISERLLSSSQQIPLMYGAYQIDLFAALSRIIPGGSEFLKNGYAVLLSSDVYGYFTGAWSGLYIDIGAFSLLAAFIWGCLAGKAWLNFKRNPNVVTSISYIFWVYSIFISFVSSPFGFSNSLLIFCWFVFFSLSSWLFSRYKIIE